MGDDGDDEDWRFSVEEVGDDDGPDGAAETARGGAETETRDDGEDSDAWGVTVGDEDDGPTVTVGGPERAAEELEEAGEGNVAGSLSPEGPVERGTPTLENAAVVGVGAVLTILVFVSLVVSDPLVLAGVAAAATAGVAGLYLFFTRV